MGDVCCRTSQFIDSKIAQQMLLHTLLSSQFSPHTPLCFRVKIRRFVLSKKYFNKFEYNKRGINPPAELQFPENPPNPTNPIFAHLTSSPPLLRLELPMFRTLRIFRTIYSTRGFSLSVRNSIAKMATIALLQKPVKMALVQLASGLSPSSPPHPLSIIVLP